MTSIAAPRPVSLGAPITVSLLLHVAMAGAIFYARSGHPAASPPAYRVNLVAAPPGERAIGVVQPATLQPPPTTAPAPKAASKPVVGKSKVRPLKSAPASPVKAATPNAVAAPAAATQAPPVAGGGPTGGKGADVANVKPDGVEFPYPAYLERVVRQIALNFKPSARGALQAEVSFLIRRDGSIAGLRVTKGSKVYGFDQDALAAVELASKSFGPLPQGFTDDVLPVIFSFDPRLIR